MSVYKWNVVEKHMKGEVNQIVIVLDFMNICSEFVLDLWDDREKMFMFYYI